MKNLRDLCESILDDEEDLLANGDLQMAKKWIGENCTGQYKVMYLKDGTLKLSSGKMIIKGYKEANFPAHVKFSSINGNIVIEKCPNLVSIAGLLVDEYVKIKGSLSISNCPKLITLKGCPIILDGSLTLVGNTSLKSLEGAPEDVFGTITLMKNGKKFKEKDINNYIKYSRRIDCSLENEEVMEGLVNEALNEPHLLKLAKVLRKNNMSFSDYIVRHIGRYAFDEIDSSHVDIYDMVDKKQSGEGMRRLRNLCSGKFIGIAIGVINNEYEIVLIPQKNLISIDHQNIRRESSTYIASCFESCDEIIIIEIPREELSTWVKRTNRANNLQGVYKPGDKWDYHEIARSNIKRYKEIIAQNKANKDNGHEKISKLVEECLQRYMKATMIVHKNPDKYADSYYSLSIMNDKISDRAGYDRGKTYGANGIMYYYEQYNTSRVNLFKPANSSFGAPNKDYHMKNLKDCESKIIEIAESLEKYFKEFGV